MLCCLTSPVPCSIGLLLWSPYVIGQTIIFSSCFFLSSFFFFLLFPSPNLSGRRLDVYHTLAHGVALVRISNAGLKCAARGSLKTQDAKNRRKIAIFAASHNFALATKARIGNRKKNLLNSNIFPTCPRNMVNLAH